MSILNSFKSFFKYNHKDVIKTFLKQELNDIYAEILRKNQEIKMLEKKRDELELMFFGA